MQALAILVFFLFTSRFIAEKCDKNHIFLR